MMGITHLVIGATTTSLLLQSADLTLIAAGAIASLFPDVDTSRSTAGRLFPWISRWLERRLPHRSCTHSLLASGVVAIATYPVAIWLKLPLGPVHAVNIGYFAGWFADLFTCSGVEMFYPNSARWVAPGNRNFRLSTNSPVEYGLLTLLIAIAVLTFNVNANGGILTEFNRLIATPTGVEQIYNQKGANHLMVAHIKGVRRSDRAAVNGDFWIIQAHGQGFVVQSADGAIYKTGKEPDVQIIAERITADTGSVAAITIDPVKLNDQEVTAALAPFNRPGVMVFVTGQIAIDDSESLAETLFVDPQQFPYIHAAGTNVTLELAPLAAVQQALGEQFAVGQLAIKSIYAQPQVSPSLSSKS